MKMRSNYAGVLLCVVQASACSATGESVFSGTVTAGDAATGRDSGAGGGPRTDGGVATDGGAARDAATVPDASLDAGSTGDAGPTADASLDAGSIADAGVTADANLDAGSTADTGVAADASLDAGSAADAGPSATSPFFTYTFNRRVYRVAAQVGATPESVSALLDRFGTGLMDRWLIPSPNGAAMVLSTDRVNCPLIIECLAITTRDLSFLEPVLPGGADANIVGTPAVDDNGSVVVYPSKGGPNGVDLWETHRQGAGWSPARLLTGASPHPFNGSPAMTLDNARVLFDCGEGPYPEGGNNDACEVHLDGSGLRIVATQFTMPNNRNDFVQFPHDSVDGVLMQGAWPIAGSQPETIWLLPSSGGPLQPIGHLLNNAVSPCGLRDGRFGALWLTRPDAPMSNHEIVLMTRDGAIEAVLTPGVDVNDIGIGCGG